jgi:hypothetical protein
MASAKPAQFKLPKSLAQCADLLYTTREERLAKQKEVDALTARESALKEHLINNLPKSDASGVAGKLARVTIVTQAIPRVENWDKLYAYIKKTNSWELLQRRLGDKAVQERWDEGKNVPGVESFNVVKVSLNKV